jgi:hypothetical protein
VYSANDEEEGAMKRSWRVPGIVAAALLTSAVATVAADDIVRTRLSGYEETPMTINSTAAGRFRARIQEDGTVIKYALTYSDLSSNVTQAHIHFGRPGLSGAVVLFLCTNGAPPSGVPVPQPCPPFPATITGTLTAADVILNAATTAQGIDGGDAGFAEMIEAIRNGAAYVNVHTMTHPGGEERGGLREEHERDHDH